MFLNCLRCTLCTRVDAHEKFPEMWKVMKDAFDQALTETYEAFQAKDTPALFFLRGHRKPLALFMGGDDIKVLEQCLKDDVPPPHTLLSRALQACRVAQSIFAEEAKMMNYTGFISQVQRGLETLVYHNFCDSEIVSFRTISAREAGKLIAGGQRSFEKVYVPVTFLGNSVTIPRSSLHDEWEFRFAGCIKSNACNSGCLPLLPWESLLFKAGAIPHTSQTVKPPEHALQEYANVRETVLHCMGTDLRTFTDMRKQAQTYSKTWLGLDRSFCLELSFLNETAEVMAKDQLHHAVLDALPSDIVKKTHKESLLALHKIKMSDLAYVTGTSVTAELEGVISMVASLEEGVGLTAKDIANFGPFYKKVVARLPHFYRMAALKSDGTEKRDLSGRAAIRELLVDVRLQIQDGANATLKLLMPLRTYNWVLEGQEIDEVNAWIQSALRVHAAAAIPCCALKDSCLDDAPAAGSASSSSTALAVIGVATPAIKTVKKKEEVVKTKSGATKNDLMKFFKGKSTM